MKILAVDDSKIVRKVTRTMLEPMGFAVDEVEDGQQAVDYCRSQMPDVILMDHNMPVMNGLDAMVLIREMPGGDNVIIIMCTTMNEMEFIKKAIGNGANEFVMKPFDADILRGKFEQLGLL